LVHKEVRTERSRALKRDMSYRVYGTRGKPVVAFPTSEAHLNQWEDFGMVKALSEYIKHGDIQLYAMDSIDEETFFRLDKRKDRGIRRYEQYLKYIANEFLPSITGHAAPPTSRGARAISALGGGAAGGASGKNQQQYRNRHPQKALLTGCSMGAFHAANIYFRYPQHIDSVIALSGVYTPAHFMDFTRGMPRSARANSTLDYLKLPIDPARRQMFRNSRLVFCTGQGPGEQEMVADTYALGERLHAQGIEAWIDFWGEDVSHDWPWWQRQIQYFLPQVLDIRPRRYVEVVPEHEIEAEPTWEAPARSR